jgi:hypothetical protein
MFLNQRAIEEEMSSTVLDDEIQGSFGTFEPSLFVL